MNGWEIACWGVVIIFVVFGLLAIFAVIHSGQISRDQRMVFDRAAYLRWLQKQEDKE